MKSHIILIDDNQVENLLHEQMLRKMDEDFEISIVDNGELALRLLKREFSNPTSEKETIIFLDESMPDLNGLEIMEALEDMEMSEESNVQVYFLTADTSLRLIEKASIMENVVGVIHKPLTNERLAEIIH
ncbi:MAG: response regulator [Crocinitomix sp.]|nr:response regulator [Crocinitomix sp.]